MCIYLYIYITFLYTLLIVHTHTRAPERRDLKPPRTVRAYCCAGHSHKATIHGSHCDSVGLLVTLIIEKYTTVYTRRRGQAKV
jgi:hypothetical protein